jgi:F-type H+-transporting ATPase subunit gamma
MPIQIKTIKKRIQSVKNIGKITRAMEMVSSYKMKRATKQVLATRAYAKIALELLVNIRQDKNILHPLLEEREVKKILVIVFASNKGLCGSYNSSVFKKVDEFVKNHSNAEIDFITIGKKAEKRIKQDYGKHIASFTDIPEKPFIEQVFPFSRLAIDGFIDKTYDQVSIIYTDFVSSVKYDVLVRKLLPVSEKVLYELINRIGENKDEKIIENKNLANYLFEPDTNSVLNQILPHLTDMQLYQSLLESNASEHSSRMITMKSASENASDMIDDLSFSFNKARQASITQEILEIASGAIVSNN